MKRTEEILLKYVSKLTSYPLLIVKEEIEVDNALRDELANRILEEVSSGPKATLREPLLLDIKDMINEELNTRYPNREKSDD